jgi:RNA polymerase sigma-70 factor, ECF subfamily
LLANLTHKTLTDSEIVHLTLTEDKNYFGLLVEKYQRQIRAYTARLLNFNQHDSEDAASNAFMKAFINLGSYNPKLKFSSWLYRIAHNEDINCIKKNSKHYSFNPQESNYLEITNFDFDKPKREDLEKILAKLSQTDRNLLILFYFEDKSINEIAEILKTSTGSVKARLSQARQKAKKFVK